MTSTLGKKKKKNMSLYQWSKPVWYYKNYLYLQQSYFWGILAYNGEKYKEYSANMRLFFNPGNCHWLVVFVTWIIFCLIFPCEEILLKQETLTLVIIYYLSHTDVSGMVLIYYFCKSSHSHELAVAWVAAIFGQL